MDPMGGGPSQAALVSPPVLHTYVPLAHLRSSARNNYYYLEMKKLRPRELSHI